MARNTTLQVGDLVEVSVEGGFTFDAVVWEVDGREVVVMTETCAHRYRTGEATFAVKVRLGPLTRDQVFEVAREWLG